MWCSQETPREGGARSCQPPTLNWEVYRQHCSGQTQLFWAWVQVRRKKRTSVNFRLGPANTAQLGHFLLQFCVPSLVTACAFHPVAVFQCRPGSLVPLLLGRLCSLCGGPLLELCWTLTEVQKCFSKARAGPESTQCTGCWCHLQSVSTLGICIWGETCGADGFAHWLVVGWLS